MPMNSSSIRKVDPILSNFVSSSIPSDSELIAQNVAEVVKVSQETGTILVENTRNFMGAPETDPQRANGAPRAKLVQFDRSSLVYKTENYALEGKISFQDIEISQFPQSEEQRLARQLTRALLLSKEKRFADTFFNTSVFTNTDTCTNIMNGKIDAAGVDALSGLDQVKELVRASAHGLHADTLIIGYATARALARNPELRSYITVGNTPSGIASGGTGVLSDQAMIEVIKTQLSIPNVFIGSARRETAMPGLTSSEAQIWNDNSLFMGIMRGGDAISQTTGNVKSLPTAAVLLEEKSFESGQFDDNDGINTNIFVQHKEQLKVIDVNLGYIVTACL